MISVARQEVERWLGRVCRQARFPQVRLVYQPRTTAGEAGSILRRDEAQRLLPPRGLEEYEVAWQAQVRAIGQPLGHLQVCLTDQETPDEQFMQACALADQISRMAGWYANLLSTWNPAEPAAEWSRSAIEQGAVRQIVEETLKSLVRLSSYRGVAFFLLDPQGKSLQLKHYLHQSLKSIRQCQRDLFSADHDRQALLVGLSVCYRQQPRDVQWLPEGVQTGVCVRVANQEGAIGTLWAFDRRLRSTEDRDLHVIQSIASQLGVILGRAVETYHSASHRRLKIELSLAAATQPPKTIAFATADGRVEACGLCLSQFDVGGDLCEVIPLDETHVCVIVGDASGHSIPAAMVMTAVRGAAYALLAEYRDRGRVSCQSGEDSSLVPAVFMQRLNRMLVQMTASHQFMSCICGVFDLVRRQFTFCNAGHPSPIHLGEASVDYLPSHGLLLGIESSVEYRQDCIAFKPGDVFVLYTDGISEALGKSNRMFRQDGIATAARLHRHASAEAITTSVWNRMLAHRAGNGESDDATILTVKLQ